MLGIEKARIVLNASYGEHTPKLTFSISGANDVTYDYGSGLYAGNDHDEFKLRIGNYIGCPSGQNRIEWNGSSLTIYDAYGKPIINAPSLVSGLTNSLSSIGGWYINSQPDYLINSGTTAGQDPNAYPFWAGGSYANRSSANFYVTSGGTVSCNSLLHNAVDLFNGNIINKNILGSGAADNKYLRGDGTWATISGSISFPSINQSSVYLRGDNTWVQISGALSYGANDNTYLRHDGNWSAVNVIPTGGLHITGDVYATGNIRAGVDVVSYYNSSDLKLKKDIKFIKNGLDVVLALHPVSFKWNDLGYKPDVSDVGLIAQEVERIIPTAVVNRGDGFKALHLEKCVPYLIQAIKELKREIDVLHSRKQ